MPEHDVAPLGERHPLHNWEYANAAARIAATGFVASDVTKWAKQIDNGTYWELTDDSPATWTQVAGPGVLPATHADQHENGGLDEIDVTGLSGVLADPQVPITENVQDVVGAMATDSSSVDFTYDDGAGTLTAIVKDASINSAKLAPADVNAQTGTTYTLQASDNNKVVTLSNASAITVTVPSGLGAGFSCLCIQIGAGQVTFSPSSTTVNNRQSHTKIAGQYGIVTLVAYAANTFVLAGDTSS